MAVIYLGLVTLSLLSFGYGKSLFILIVLESCKIPTILILIDVL